MSRARREKIAWKRGLRKLIRLSARARRMRSALKGLQDLHKFMLADLLGAVAKDLCLHGRVRVRLVEQSQPWVDPVIRAEERSVLPGIFYAPIPRESCP